MAMGKHRNRLSPIVPNSFGARKNKDFLHVPPDAWNRRGACDAAIDGRIRSPDSFRQFAVAELRSRKYLAGAIRFERSTTPKWGKPRIGRQCGESGVKD